MFREQISGIRVKVGVYDSASSLTSMLAIRTAVIRA